MDTFDIPLFKYMKLNKEKLIIKSNEVIQEIVTKVSTAIKNTRDNNPIILINIKQLQDDSNSLEEIISNLLSRYNKEDKINEHIRLLTFVTGADISRENDAYCVAIFE